ncbi:MAG: prephenate dehydrogenase [Chloroflexi bacterium]|nr:prephenate dehydrogenase [Chloroflexota bacterium]
MPVQITIIGLGQIGASIGLALAAHKDKAITIGHDKDFSIEQRAKKLGAVTATNHNLPGAVENADLVILAIPVHQVRETFNYIAQDLKKDAVVVDMTPVKAEVAKWAREILPASAHYVGLIPAIGAGHLDIAGAGLDSAKADLFSKSVFLLSTPPGAPGAAVKLVSDMVSLLGATTILTDFVESDGLMASANILPRLVSAALLNATVDQPGWQESRKVASLAYYRATSALSETEDTESLSMLAVQNRENVIRLLDQMTTALLELRDELENENSEALKKRLESARQGRIHWLAERGKADWTHIPGERVEKISIMESLLGSKLGKMGKRGK